MTPAGMAALRRAATLAHALPGLRIRVRQGQRTLLEVARPPLPAGPVVCPCSFRRSVTRAHEDVKAGARLAFLGMPDGSDPAVDVGVPNGDAALPGGIYRLARGDVDVHAFASTLLPRRARDVIDRRTTATGGVRLHVDAATEVTLVHTVGARGRGAEHHAVLEDLLGAFVAEEIACDLGSASS